MRTLHNVRPTLNITGSKEISQFCIRMYGEQKKHIFFKNHKICVKVAIILISFLLQFLLFEISKKVKFSPFWSCDPPLREKIGDFFAFFAKLMKIQRKKSAQILFSLSLKLKYRLKMFLTKMLYKNVAILRLVGKRVFIYLSD